MKSSWKSLSNYSVKCLPLMFNRVRMEEEAREAEGMAGVIETEDSLI